MGNYIRRCGIYVIHNIISDKRYIGYSRNINKRWDKHKHELRRGLHKNEHLQNSWFLHKEDSFVFYIIETCDNMLSNQELEAIETKWVLHFNTHQREFGYNATLPGSIPLKEIGENTTKKGRHSTILPIICINKLTGEMVEHLNSTAVEKNIGLKRNKVNDCCLYWEGKIQNKKKGWKEWLFVRKRNFIPDFDYIHHNKQGGKKISITAWNENEEITFNSITDASNKGFRYDGIKRSISKKSLYKNYFFKIN